MSTIDVESAYHHADMLPSSCPYLGFNGKGSPMCSVPYLRALPSPWVFTNRTRELTGRWRRRGLRLPRYLDDSCLQSAVTPGAVLQRAPRLSSRTWTKQGFSVSRSVSREQLELAPSRERKFLGFILDTASTVIPGPPCG
jgi:hypothetical protein